MNLNYSYNYCWLLLSEMQRLIPGKSKPLQRFQGELFSKLCKAIVRSVLVRKSNATKITQHRRNHHLKSHYYEGHPLSIDTRTIKLNMCLKDTFLKDRDWMHTTDTDICRKTLGQTNALVSDFLKSDDEILIPAWSKEDMFIFKVLSFSLIFSFSRAFFWKYTHKHTPPVLGVASVGWSGGLVAAVQAEAAVPSRPRAKASRGQLPLLWTIFPFGEMEEIRKNQEVALLPSQRVGVKNKQTKHNPPPNTHVAHLATNSKFTRSYLSLRRPWEGRFGWGAYGEAPHAPCVP